MISRKDIERQYARAKTEGWLDVFEDIAREHDTTAAHFLAIGSRETNLKNIKGDFRGGKAHGFGVMQVDVGTDPNFTKQWSEENAVPGILRGGEIYQEKVDQIKAGQGKRLKVRGKQFTGKPAESDDIRRIATAAYNSGLWAYYHFSNGNHVDSTTTGKDYSRDVYDRAIGFAQLREADGEVGALAREVDLQGKYAREEHKKLVTTRPHVPVPQEEPEIKPDVPAKPQPPTTIPAVPPLPVNVPGWAKKIVGWGAGLNIGSLGVAFATLRDNPQALAAVLEIIKYGVIALCAALAFVVLGLFIKSMWHAKLANDLNMARLHNYANKDTENVDFSGWKAAPDKAEVKL